MLIYADNAATTAPAPTAVQAALRAMEVLYGNPGSPHRMGRQARQALCQAREDVAQCLGAQADEVYFTGGGTEGNNWAVETAGRLGAAEGKRHIVTTAIEHPSVLRPLERLEQQGFEITRLPVGERGVVQVEELRASLRPDTCLVSVMYVNNEVGTIQPVREIGALCRERGILFHTDAVQAVGHIPVDAVRDNVDLLTLSGHKLHAPKGVGALYCRRGIPPESLLLGGGQERGRRSGTENVPGALALAAAMRESMDTLEEDMRRLTRLRDTLADGLSRIPGALRNADPALTAPGIVSFCFEGVEGESLLLGLDLAGICAGSGSACASGSGKPSHVLLALGRSPELARGALRLSLCRYNTAEEVEHLIRAVTDEVEKLRRLCRGEG